MKKIFCSGSCRLLTTIADGHDHVLPIHSMFYNFVGINFLGKLHNIKQHIQFVKFLKGEIEIPSSILPKFLTSYSCLEKFSGCTMEPPRLLPCKINSIRKQWDECEWYVFEICSLKLYRHQGYEVQCELTTDHDPITLQTDEDLMKDLFLLRSMIPQDKKILFQVHFRLDVIHQDPSQQIPMRETIFRTVEKFCREQENTFIYDPSMWLKSNPSHYGNATHLNPVGHQASFDFMVRTFFSRV